MGRLIDANVLREEVNSWGMNDYEPSDFTDAIDDSPTVEAIPQVDYEARLKADMVAMLTEILLEIEEEKWALSNFDDIANDYVVDLEDVDRIIQEKINSLKEQKDGTDKSNK